MTGYNAAHGDTAAIALDLNNDEGMYRAYMGIVQDVPWWDDEDNTWNDIDRAARRLRDLVGELREYADTYPDDGTVGEIRDADLTAVDWEQLITDELREINANEGRDAEAGL